MKKSNFLFQITPDKAPHDLPGFSGTALDDTYGATSRYLTKNGKPYICRMGEMHYSRVPEEYWEDALSQVPEMDDAVDKFLQQRLKGREPGQKELKRTIDALQRRGHSWADIRAGLRRYSASLDADLEESYE
jgi:hypothetical protein